MNGNKIAYSLIALILTLSIALVLFNEYMLICNRNSDLWTFVILFFVVIICVIHNISKNNADPYEIINPSRSIDRILPAFWTSVWN